MQIFHQQQETKHQLEIIDYSFHLRLQLKGVPYQRTSILLQRRIGLPKTEEMHRFLFRN